tara:strand:- start:174 stop:890 length:717 start_codon:yes stop_codon:yes gene_type:complete
LNVNFFDYKIESNKSFLHDLFYSKKSINTINPHSFIVAKNDINFNKSLIESTYLIPDGIGIIYAIKLLNGVKINRYSGAELHHDLLEIAESKKMKIFYMGSSNNTLNLIKKKIKSNYNNIELDYFSPPYKNEFTQSENKLIIEKINKFSPDILFVGLTAPKQEKWINNNLQYLNIKLACGIGAVFDFYSGNIKRAPEWVMKLNLEWLHRSLISFRLFKRNFISNPKFIFFVLAKYLKK